jgi:hypothetical protein
MSENLCKNVFKDNRNTTNTNDYTAKWIEIINTLESRNLLPLVGGGPQQAEQDR